MAKLTSSIAAPGTPAYNPTWYALANTGIFWDPANLSGLASDNNSGASALLPVLTWAEIVRRFGSDSPTMAPGNNAIINKLSAQTLNVDPVFFFPRLSNGGYSALIDTLVVFAAASAAGTVTLLSAAGGTDMTIANMPAGTTAGMLVYNSSIGGGTGAYAFVKSMAGSTATMCQPMNANLCTTIGIPTFALGTNWATGNTIVVYNIPNLTNLKAWRPIGSGDVSAGGAVACVGWVQFTQIADSSGAANSEYPLVCDGANAVLSCCYVANRVNLIALSGRNQGVSVINCYMVGNVLSYGATMAIYGGTIVGALTAISTAGSSAVVDGNLIVQGVTLIQSGCLQVNHVHFIGNITVSPGATLKYIGGAAMFGAAAVSVGQNAAFVNASGASWVASYLLTGAMTLGASATGSYYTPGTGLWVGGVNVTPANLDAAPGVQGALSNPQTNARFCAAA